MVHLVARSYGFTLLFRTAAEGRHLLQLATRYFPGARALVLMPDHVHVLTAEPEPTLRLARFMRAYARWRNARRGVGGPVWQSAPPPEVPSDEQHERRLARYIFLNPCRRALVDDPLAWPWGTYREVCGFGAGLPAPRAHRPDVLHAYVSADPSTRLDGTPLPATTPAGPVELGAVEVAVSALLRVPLEELPADPRAARLVVRAAAATGMRDWRTLGAWSGRSRASLFRAAAALPARLDLADEPALASALGVLGDARFPPIEGGDLVRLPTWTRYRGRR